MKTHRHYNYHARTLAYEMNNQFSYATYHREKATEFIEF